MIWPRTFAEPVKPNNCFGNIRKDLRLANTNTSPLVGLFKFPFEPGEKEPLGYLKQPGSNTVSRCLLRTWPWSLIRVCVPTLLKQKLMINFKRLLVDISKDMSSLWLRCPILLIFLASPRFISWRLGRKICLCSHIPFGKWAVCVTATFHKYHWPWYNKIHQ